MITIKESSQNTIVVKKSKFLGFAFRVQSEQQAQSILHQHKKQYYDATHNCYAYVLKNGEMRYSDDGEPQGTAGRPMLEVIKRSELQNLLVISTRYFGGTLLGAGGLVRAYSQSASSALAAAQKVQIIPCSIFQCTFTYNTWAKAEKRLTDAGYMLDDVEYTGDVIATVAARAGSEDALGELVTSLSLGQSTLDPIGQKYIEQPI